MVKVERTLQRTRSMTATENQQRNSTKRRRPRERILEAAPEVLREAGLVRFGLVEVARAAQVSRQTIYNHFASRDDLLAELFVQQMRSAHVPLLAKFADEEPSAESFIEIMLTELAVGRTFPLFEDLLSPVTAPRIAELIFHSPAVAATREELWMPILERYRDAGLLRESLDLPEAVRWITYQQFWLVTYPDTMCPGDDQSVAHVIRTYLLPGLLADVN
jgi:AcrR family transcriptional regulator